MIDLAAAFRAVVAALEAIEAEYVVVGSTAAAGWGVARATRDVDLVAVIPPNAVDALLDSLDRDDLYVPSVDVRRAVAGSGSFNVLHMASGGKVDVFVAADGDAFERSRLDRRIDRRCSASRRGSRRLRMSSCRSCAGVSSPARSCHGAIASRSP